MCLGGICVSIIITAIHLILIFKEIVFNVCSIIIIFPIRVIAVPHAETLFDPSCLDLNLLVVLVSYTIANQEAML